jgi:hypothetical protein
MALITLASWLSHDGAVLITLAFVSVFIAVTLLLTARHDR